MSGRHRLPHSKSNLVIGTIAASVGVSSVLAAAVVELVSPEPSASAAQVPAQTAQQPLTQQGRLVSVTPDSLTAQSANGAVQTYTITPNTTAITDGGHAGTPESSFAVNDEVTVVGTQQGGTLSATAVADQSSMGPNGRPMDFGL
jgi:hypothetical protein